jgi:hypothetical protein
MPQIVQGAGHVVHNLASQQVVQSIESIAAKALSDQLGKPDTQKENSTSARRPVGLGFAMRPLSIPIMPFGDQNINVRRSVTLGFALR